MPFAAGPGVLSSLAVGEEEEEGECSKVDEEVKWEIPNHILFVLATGS